MSVSTNDILNAFAKVIECRSHRRGRKPNWNILVFTNDSGKVTVMDLETECKTVAAKSGKRAYTKHAGKRGPGRPRKVDAVASDVRISAYTGKPVRTYTKRNAVAVAVAVDEVTSVEIAEADKAICQLAEAKVQLAQAKLARDNTDNAKKRAMMDKVIKLMECKVSELDKFVNG